MGAFFSFSGIAKRSAGKLQQFEKCRRENCRYKYFKRGNAIKNITPFSFKRFSSVLEE